jgi:hypothetical protein
MTPATEAIALREAAATIRAALSAVTRLRARGPSEDTADLLADVAIRLSVDAESLEQAADVMMIGEGFSPAQLRLGLSVPIIQGGV